MEKMILRKTAEQQNSSFTQPSCDRILNQSQDKESSMMFPYIGPPGKGPGLLGSKPGAGSTGNLIALEHYAASLKSALEVAASLKKRNRKELYEQDGREDFEVTYDSLLKSPNEYNSSSDSTFSS